MSCNFPSRLYCGLQVGGRGTNVRTLRRGFGIGALLTLLLLPLLPVSTAEEFEVYVEPQTPVAAEVYDLFLVITGVALFVFVLVEGLLLYTLWRFRNNTDSPEGETERGHTKAEVVWTIIPAVILIGLGVLSAGTLAKTDAVPEQVDFTVKVDAFQWGWRFVYPDGNATVNVLRVQEGSVVGLDVTSRDVIHSVWIPAFALKLDAVPGQVHKQSFVAPPVTDGDPDEYFLQCAEFCGLSHHAMHAQVLVFAKDSQPLPYGKLPPPPPPPATNETTNTSASS